MLRRFPRVYAVLVTVAMVWAAANCVYVYLAQNGARAYRIESAVLIFAAVAAMGVESEATDRPVARAEATWRSLALPGALTVVWLAIFLPLLSFPFLSDDYVFLAAYRSFADVTKPFQFYRPGFALLFVLLRGLGGASPVVFHAAGFALHLASSVLVYQLALGVLGRSDLATSAFAIFLFNPLQPEAVLWVSGLQELLWTFFALAALVCYVAKRELTAARTLAVAGLVACALASKETAVCFFLLVPVFDAVLFRFRRGRMMWAAYSLFAFEAALYFGLRQRAIGLERSFFDPPDRFLLKELTLEPYEYLVHPWNRVAVHVPAAVFCAVSLAMLIVLFQAARRGVSIRLILGPAIVFAGVLPVYTFFYVAPDLAGARYMYFAAAGFALFLADLLGASVTLPSRAAACSVAVACVLAVSLAMNLGPWRSAGELVEAMARALRQGRSVSDVLREWDDGGIALELRDGVPRARAGVWIFANGYDEFVRWALAH